MSSCTAKTSTPKPSKLSTKTNVKDKTKTNHGGGPGSSSSSSCATHEKNKQEAATITTEAGEKGKPKVSFSHIELYADKLDDLDIYKTFENQLYDFDHSVLLLKENQQLSLEEKRRIWNNIRRKSLSKSSVLEQGIPSFSSDGDEDTANAVFVSHGRDVVKQLLGGLGFRITGVRHEDEGEGEGGGGEEQQQDNKNRTRTRSVLITSPDPAGVQIVVTSMEGASNSSGNSINNQDSTAIAINQNQDGVGDCSSYDIMSSIQRFRASHNGRPGIGVLGFIVNGIEEIKAKYEQHHPDLLASYRQEVVDSTGENDNDNDETSWKVLEVFAYYKDKDNKDDVPDSSSSSSSSSSTSGKDEVSSKVADRGTILRFIEPSSSSETTEDDATSLCYNVLGLRPVPAHFGLVTIAGSASSPATTTATVGSAYFDHWVSNVYSRTDFIEILHDTLGFTPKVDYNAGVVAAGEARIESTVTGNTISTIHDDDVSILDTSSSSSLSSLRDQSQVYLPINNALSNVGHVHGFLQELGQGIQHIASRVSDLVQFVQCANDRRNVIGEGLTFLRIPRSYYGVLTIDDFRTTNPTTASTIRVVAGECYVCLERPTAEDIMDCLILSNVVGKDGAVDLEFTRSQIDTIIMNGLQPIFAGTSSSALEEYMAKRDDVLNVILQSRYRNLIRLINGRNHNHHHDITEETYLGIVRNHILVDVQGDNLLYQIFTSNILQRIQYDEAPFFEFVQRVCSTSSSSSLATTTTEEAVADDNMDHYNMNVSKQVERPGCGGFGIRNFLTLFLSIEVSKAMEEVIEAQLVGDIAKQKYAQSMVDTFTLQLNEANPILSMISDAMTEEGYCQDQIDHILLTQQKQQKHDNSNGDAGYEDDKETKEDDKDNDNTNSLMLLLEKWKKQKDDASKKKSEGNEMLMECSLRYNDMMKSIRETKKNAIDRLYSNN